MPPRVTVLIPVFDREAFVGEAIESVLAQDVRDLELVIVDDGSTDRTPEILREWAARDERIVVVTAPRNLGIAEAPNLGLRHARAELVARLDSDDVMTPGRLASQLDVLEKQPDVVLVSTAYELIDREGRHLGTFREVEPHEVVRYFLGFYNLVGGGGHVMFRRAAVLDLGGYDGSFPSSEDYDLWVRLLQRGRLVVLPSIGMKQRQHDARATSRFQETKRRNWTAIMRKTLGPLLGREVEEEEIDALITLWRFDGAPGRAALADRVMREAFARFCEAHRDRELRTRVRRRTARQWVEAARLHARGGRRLEAMRYRLRALRWSALHALAMMSGRRRPEGA